MRTLLSWFFYSLGVAFFVLILASVYVYVADVFGVRSFVTLVTTHHTPEVGAGAEIQNPSAAPQGDHPYLSETQEAALKNVGINPAAVPSSVTDAQKTCLVNAVGETRANEIKAGALPTVAEIVKARSCF